MCSTPRAIGLGCFVAVALVTALPDAATAQTRAAFRNGDGEWEWKQIERSQELRRKEGPDVELVADTFRVSYQDVTLGWGVGFNDPVLGAERRSTLRAVLEYVASLIDVPGTADLHVLASQTDGGTTLAAGGPYLLPELGFQGGLVYEHLTTGVDPVSDLPDGTIVVDFGFPWASDPDAPSESEYDLHSALLHEVSHALGIVSTLGPDARSMLFNEAGAGVFTFFDALLIRESTEAPLLLAGGAFNASAEDVSSDDIIFVGERARAFLGAFVPIFSPSPFLLGSSIGHWALDADEDAVMQPDLPMGVARRQYLEWELQALGDLGYAVVACGDGFVAGEEECDDANFVELDGCDAACRLEDDQERDAGVPDAGMLDAGVPDAGMLDAGMGDAGTPDAGSPDAGLPDAGGADPDAGAPLGPPSAPPPGSPDAGDAPPDEPTPVTNVVASPEQGCAVRRGEAGAAWTFAAVCFVLMMRRKRYGLIS